MGKNEVLTHGELINFLFIGMLPINGFIVQHHICFNQHAFRIHLREPGILCSIGCKELDTT